MNFISENTGILGFLAAVLSITIWRLPAIIYSVSQYKKDRLREEIYRDKKQKALSDNIERKKRKRKEK